MKHHFPVVGHTYLPCDRDYGLIEKYVRSNCSQVYTPEHWANTVRTAKKKQQFTVYAMQLADFKCVSLLQQQITKRSITNEGSNLNVANASVFCFEKEATSILRMCYSYSLGNDDYENMSIQKRGRPTGGLDVFTLPDKGSRKLAILGQKAGRRDVPTYVGSCTLQTLLQHP